MKRLLSNNVWSNHVKRSSSSVLSSSTSRPMILVNVQVRSKGGNKTSLWGRPKGHRYLRGQGIHKDNRKDAPRYHNQDRPEKFDVMKYHMKQDRLMDEVELDNMMHLMELYNEHQIPTPEYTELIPAQEHPFVKLCLGTSDEQWDQMTVMDIIEAMRTADPENSHILPFEVAFNLPIEQQKELWDYVEREIHPLIAELDPMELVTTDVGPTTMEEIVDREIDMFRSEEWQEAFSLVEDIYIARSEEEDAEFFMSYTEILNDIREDLYEQVESRAKLFKLDQDFSKLPMTLGHKNNVDKAEAYALQMWYQGLKQVSPHAEHARRYVEEYKSEIAFTEKDGDRLFELHKENPQYWTGDRLAASFGISRNQAWGEIIVREADEAHRTGKPFCPDKIDYLFHRDEYQIKVMQQRFIKNESRSEFQYLREATSGQSVDEDAIYKKFLEKTSKPIAASGLDDDLPDWVKIPFQPPRTQVKPTEVAQSQEQQPQGAQILQYPKVKSQAKLGTDLVRHRHRVIDMMSKSRINQGEQRKFMVLETDGVLRTMERDTVDWINLKPQPFTRLGLGGKEKRRQKFRNRQF